MENKKSKWIIIESQELEEEFETEQQANKFKTYCESQDNIRNFEVKEIIN